MRTDAPDRRFAPGSVLGTDPAVAGGPLTVAGSREHSGRLAVAFEGVADRTVAESLRGVLLVVARASAPPLDDPDEFWDHDLVGLRVRTVDGEGLGEVAEVLHLPGGSTLSVRRPDGRELLLPFVHAMVPTVDVTGGVIEVDPPPGLLDLDGAD